MRASTRVRDAVVETIKLRHQGEEDVTVITQDALLSTFDRIFTALTLTLAGIASISLAVAGVLIMNVMLVSVSQRTAEVGLLKAIGATQRQITALFLTEAILLSLAGAMADLLIGLGVDWIVGRIYPALPLRAADLGNRARGRHGGRERRHLRTDAGAARCQARSGRCAGGQALMRFADLVRLTTGSVRAHRLRATLTALGIGIGVTAVVLLTSIGEGVHRFVVSEFTQFGTNIVSVTPGKTQTMGASIGAFGNIRPLTVDDAEALRRAPYVLTRRNAMMQGNAEVEALGRKRRTTIYGVGPAFAEAFRFEVAQGEFLPADDPRAPRSLAVLGSRMNAELFRGANALGQAIRVGGQRYRVAGVMRPKGTTLGFDLDDTVFIPTAKALELFDRDSVFEIQLHHEEGVRVEEVVEGHAAHPRCAARRRGFHHHDAAADAGHARLGAQRADVRGGRARQHLAAGRRRRHLHDHDDRRQRADGRDRLAAGAGCAEGAGVARVPVGGGRVVGDRRHRRADRRHRHRRGAGSRRAGFAGQLLAAVHCRCRKRWRSPSASLAGILPAMRAADLEPVEALRTE